jgi:uncharacterized membrane protein YccF (DUF307 family)
MRLLGNILWLIFGGLEMALGWFVAGIVMYISFIGFPWGRSCFVIGMFTLFPFGQQVVNRERLQGHGDIGTGPAGTLGNLIWFLVAGWWLALGHLVVAICLFITIIGIPFAIQHLKLAGVSLFPVGKTVVSNETARHL